MKYLILALIALSLGCGKKDDAPSKNLFSTWVRDSNGTSVNMNGGSFGTFTMAFLFNTGAICTCSMTVAGTQASGNFTLAGCSYTSGGPGDPGCAAINSTQSYTNVSAVLTVCLAGTCATYH